jgi:hypothetical protein
MLTQALAHLVYLTASFQYNVTPPLTLLTWFDLDKNSVISIDSLHGYSRWINGERSFDTTLYNDRIVYSDTIKPHPGEALRPDTVRVAVVSKIPTIAITSPASGDSFPPTARIPVQTSLIDFSGVAGWSQGTLVIVK